MEQVKINRLIAGYERENLTQRQINNRLKKEELKEQEEKNQKRIKSMIINIEWKKSTTWGSCPTAQARINYVDGTFGTSENYKAGGCGYDKESTVISNIFNETLKYKLWEIQEEKNIPYGITLSKEYNNYYASGVGTSCYYSIVEFLGGKMVNTSSSKTFDVFTIEF